MSSLRAILFLTSISVSVQCVASILARAPSERLLFKEDFYVFDKGRWQHLVMVRRGGNNEFQYYSGRPENRFTYIFVSLFLNSFYRNKSLFIQLTTQIKRLFGKLYHPRSYSYVRDGVLFIRPKFDSADLPSWSGFPRIRKLGTFLVKDVCLIAL